MPLDSAVLSNARYAPTTIIGQNLTVSGAALLGLGCLVLPAALGVPLPSILMGVVFGAILALTVMLHVFRWRPLMRLAAKSRKASGASHVLALIQAESLSPGRPTSTEYHGAGWLLVHDDRLAVEFRNSSWSIQKHADARDVMLADIDHVFARDGSSAAFPALDVVQKSGRTLRVTLVPADGLGWHGPSDIETSDAADGLQHRLGAEVWS